MKDEAAILVDCLRSDIKAVLRRYRDTAACPSPLYQKLTEALFESLPEGTETPMQDAVLRRKISAAISEASDQAVGAERPPHGGRK